MESSKILLIAPKSLDVSKDSYAVRMDFSELFSFFARPLKNADESTSMGRALAFCASIFPSRPIKGTPCLERARALIAGEVPDRRAFFKGRDVVFDGYPEAYGVYFAFLLQEIPNISASWACPFHPAAPEEIPFEEDFYAILDEKEIQLLGYPSKAKYEKRKEEALEFRLQTKRTSI